MPDCPAFNFFKVDCVTAQLKTEAALAESVNIFSALPDTGH
jgi:hypothetical protein